MATGTITKSIGVGSNIGTFVDLSAYTTSDYVCPDDGYIQISARGENGHIIASIGGTNGCALSVSRVTNDYEYASCYVRKGTKVRYSASTSAETIRYYPLR